MFCSSCGTENPPGSPKCTKCGSPLGASPASAPAVAPRSWWSKNKKWFLPTLILVLVVLPILFFGGIFMVVMSSIKQSDVAKHAFARAQSNPAVIEKLGTPMEIGWLVSGSINVSTASGDADLAMPISGPKGKGKIFVVAAKSGGEWSYSRMDVQIEGLPARINLLAVSTAAAPTATPGESINLTSGDFRLVFTLTETKDGPARAAAPYKLGDNVFAKYDLGGFGLGPQGQVEVGLAVTPVDPAGLPLEKTWTDTVRGSFSDKPINGSYQFHIPDFAPPGTYRLVIKAHDAVKNTDAEFAPTFSVAAVSPVAPATQLEIRNYRYLSAEKGPVLSPAVYAPGQTVHYRYDLFGMQFRDDKASFHTAYKVLGPNGESLIDRPDWDSTEDTVVYHPATAYKEFSGYITLPSSAVKGTYKQQYTVQDRQTNTILIHETQFEVR